MLTITEAFVVDYVYSIVNDFPGGVFTSAISDRLQALCEAQIPGDTLQNIGSDGTSVTLTFENALSGAEKTILDGNTSNPAGGLIAKSTEYFDVMDGVNVVMDGSTLQQQSDGILSTALTLQLRNGNGTPIGGSGQAAIDIDPGNLGPITATSGAFGAVNGQFGITVGPTLLRGIVALTVKSGSLPERHVNIEFA